MAFFFCVQSHGTVKEVFGDMDAIDGKLYRCPAVGIYRWKRKKPYHLVPREGVELLKKVVLLILKSLRLVTYYQSVISMKTYLWYLG